MPSAPTLYAKNDLPRDISSRKLPALVAGNLALDFVNTTGRQGGPSTIDNLMPGYSNLLEWSEHAAIVSPDEAHRMQLLAGRNARDAAAIRKRAIALRAALYAILPIHADGDESNGAALELLAAEIQLAIAARTLDRSAEGFRWVWISPLALDRPLAEVSLAAETLLTGDRLSRVRQCDAPGCERVFLDTSRNGLRRYCTASGCGTRERVRQFRQRQRNST